MNDVCKRFFDIVLSLCGLIVGAPLMAIIAGALWLEAPGEVIFVQERLGRHGRRFRLYKFRKFAPDIGTSGTGVTVVGDARMTPIGRILERTKFDELPQLWNILEGDMSFVGPRPETPRFADLFEGEFAAVLNYTPGIFGPNQVAFRNESAMYPPDEDPEIFYRQELFPVKARNDLDYFTHANCLSDLAWIARGLWASVSGVLDWRRFASLHLPILLTDIVTIACAWALAWAMRYGIAHRGDIDVLMGGWLVMVPVMVMGLVVGGCYSHPLRAFSIPDAMRLLSAASFSWLLGFVILIGIVNRGTSIMLAPLGWLCVMPLLFAPRVARRLMWEHHKKSQVQRGSPKVVIYGANRLGECLCRWLTAELPQYNFIGFMDNDPEMQGRRVNGYRVIGRTADMAAIHERYQPDEIWLAGTLDPGAFRWLQDQAQKLGIQVVNIIDQDPFRRSVAMRVHSHAEPLDPFEAAWQAENEEKVVVMESADWVTSRNGSLVLSKKVKCNEQ